MAALARVKTWTDGEVLFASDLNAEFDSILDDDGVTLGWPATGNKDFDGNSLILDSGGTSLISASTDNIISFQLNGVENMFRIDGTTASAVNGVEILPRATGVDADIKAFGETNAGLNLVPKGTGTLKVKGFNIGSYPQILLAQKLFGGI